MLRCCTLMYIVVQQGVMMCTNQQHYYNNVQWCYTYVQPCTSVLQQHIMRLNDIETWYRTRWLCVTMLRDVVMMCKSSFQWNDKIGRMLRCYIITCNNAERCHKTEQQCFIDRTTLSRGCYLISTLLNIVELSYEHVTMMYIDCNIVTSSNIQVHLQTIMYM